MNAKKCDRCGRYYDKNVRQSYILAKQQVLSDLTERIDLCKQCADELEEWFRKEDIEKVKKILEESEANTE